MALRTVNNGKLIESKSDQREDFRLTNELRDFALQYFRGGPFQLTTTDGAAHTIWASDAMPTGAVWSVTARVQVQGDGDHKYLQIDGLFFRLSGGGVTTQDGATSATVALGADPDFSAAFVIAGNAVAVKVTDANTRADSWAAWIEVRQSA